MSTNHTEHMLKEKASALLPGFIYKYVESIAHKRIIEKWNKDGNPSPPPHVIKQQVILEYAQLHHIDTLVETGTFKGQMIEAQKGNFKKIISIELDESWHSKATEKFKKNEHIELVLGDSSKVLKDVFENRSNNIVFWLDGHYSGPGTALGDKQCPILEELDTIFANGQDHVILIDDARLFNGENDYPTMDELKQYVSNKSSNEVEVRNDIIRITNSKIKTRY